ncbi:T9SS type A sorting domain-containing protein [candidate division KSB1 bacterium]|nr:T9SS type A sorting domain-containing protein [candidate division KSB1 bacterium]
MKTSNIPGSAFMVLAIITLLINTPFAVAEQPAFPGAEGSGRFASGGRGGSVYEVTTLSNSGPGSLVDAVRSGNRSIVFRVSGTIELGSVILTPKSNTTIAGQTAPGDGICIKGRIRVNASNIIIRYIRVRVDAGAANSDGDAIDISGGTNIIIDHVSASYARDEGISCQPESDMVTVQWCIISEGLTFENHSYGSLIRGDYGDQKTYHHNLYAHNWGRLPRPGNYTDVTDDPEGLYLDFCNNVIYNWQGSRPGYNDDSNTMSRYNFIGNVYIRGPESSPSTIFRENGVHCIGYFENNSMNGIVPADPWSLVSFRSGYTAEQIAAYKARSALIEMEPVTTTSPEQAKTDVLVSAGASLPKRDTIDTRIVNDVLNRTGHSIATVAEQPEGGWPALNSLPAPDDNDHDGMPDDWEQTNGLNPNDPEDRNNIGQDGYTMLEVYLNSLAHDPTGVEQDASFFPQDFVLFQNYPNPFNPTTTISFLLANQSYATLKIYDLYGREIAVLVDGLQSAGQHEVQFDGSGLPSGLYFVRLQAGLYAKTIKMLLAK